MQRDVQLLLSEFPCHLTMVLKQQSSIENDACASGLIRRPGSAVGGTLMAGQFKFWPLLCYARSNVEVDKDAEKVWHAISQRP